MIVVDTREPQSIKSYAQNFFKGKYHLEIKELPEGDIKYKNIIFERKRIDDFISSITDGRFKSQKRKLVEKQLQGYHCYVVIQGEYQDLDDAHILPKKAVAGAIASLNEYGIHTIHVGYYDYEMMFEIIHGIMRKYNEEKVCPEVFVEPEGLTWTQKALACINGVGVETAKNITKVVQHLRRFYEADYKTNQELLMEAEGVGVKTSETILKELWS